MLAEKAVVAEPVDKEAVAFGADLLHALPIAIAQERRGHREVGIHGVAQRLAFVFDHLVIILHPLVRLFRRHKGKRQRAHAELRGLNDRLGGWSKPSTAADAAFAAASALHCAPAL